MQKKNNLETQQCFGMNSNTKCSNPNSLFQLKPFVSIWSIKPGFPLIQSLSKSFRFYPSNTSPISCSPLHLFAIVMIQDLRTFPQVSPLLVLSVSIYCYTVPDESFYIPVLVKFLPKLVYASQSTIEEVTNSAPPQQTCE